MDTLRLETPAALQLQVLTELFLGSHIAGAIRSKDRALYCTVDLWKAAC